MLPVINGKVAHIFDQSDFDADLICGLDNCTVVDSEILKNVCMKDIAPDFQGYVEPGDVVVCAENFEYGHPHVGGPIGLQLHGITAFLAESFCPGFYRANSLRGVPLIECRGLLREIRLGERIEFDWDKSELHLLDSKKVLVCEKIPQKNLQLIELGGVMEYIKKVRLKESSAHAANPDA